jgi:hypothetical protein
MDVAPTAQQPPAQAVGLGAYDYTPIPRRFATANENSPAIRAGLS